MIHYRKLAILTLTGILLGTLPNVSASATEAGTLNKETVVTEDTVAAEDADTKNTEAAALENEEEATASKIDYKEQLLTITKEGFVADSFQGVDALYRKGRSDGSSTTYSCAAYIKKFYKEIYGVSVNNLFAGATPRSSKGTFKLVKTPEAGDIVACQIGRAHV